MRKIKIGMVIPTWGKQCGVADYTKELVDHTEDQSVQFKIYSDLNHHLPSIIKDDSIDLIHFQYEYSIYDFDPLFWIMSELTKLNIPLITTLHSWSNELIAQNLLIFGRSRAIIVHSHEIKQLAVQQGYAQDRLVVMPIGCRTFELQAKEKTSKLFNLKGYPRIGFFGFPFPHKGICNLIDAIQELRLYFPEITGYFFSHYPNYLDKNHPYYSFYQELESQFKNQDHLIWTKEYLPEMAIVNLLHNMDVNLLPYEDHNQKGISAAVRLMLAAKRPVITTDYAYFSDLEDEVFKIPDTSIETIASSICQILMNSRIQERLISKGNLFLEKRNWKTIGSSYRDFYRKLVTTREDEDKRT